MRKSAKLRRQNKKEPTGAVQRLMAKMKGFGQKSKPFGERPDFDGDIEQPEPRENIEQERPKEDIKIQKSKSNPVRQKQKSKPKRQVSSSSIEEEKPLSITDRLNPKLVAERLKERQAAKEQGRLTKPGRRRASGRRRRSKGSWSLPWSRLDTRSIRVTKKGAMLLLGGVLTIALISLIVIIGTRVSMRNYLEQYDGEVFLTGITIDGVDVSGMTMSEGLQELINHQRMLQNRPITFRLENGGSFSGTMGELGLGIEQLDTVAREAFDYGREFSLSRRVRLLRNSNEGLFELNFPVTYQVSLNRVTEFLESHMEDVLSTPINARMESGAGGVTIVPDQIGEVFDVDHAYQEISDYINGEWDIVSASIDLVIIQEEADILASQLEEMTDLLGTFTTTFYDSPANRAQNIATGAGHITHLFMAPGDELSACTLMRPYTEENGYAYGSMFAGHMVVEAIGGGVCQVASTLYMALLHAEVEIVQRNNHTMPVDYVPLAMDAAVAEDVLDLRWRNNMSTPIYIESVVVPGQSITYNIFGRETRPENRTIEFVNWAEWGEAPEGAQFVASQYGIGAMWLVSEARAPITARLYKVIFIDGEEVERVQVNASHYLESPRIWSVGTASPNPEITSWMLGAIGSQSYDYIRSTINQILSGGGGGGYTGGYTGGYESWHPEEYAGGYGGYSGGY